MSLHHPLRKGDLHGFVNLFAAGVFVSGRADNETTPWMLEEPDGRRFRFSDSALSWSDLVATADQITLARQTLVTSFGSCSFDEPRHDLRALGLIS